MFPKLIIFRKLLISMILKWKMHMRKKLRIYQSMEFIEAKSYVENRVSIFIRITWYFFLFRSPFSMSMGNTKDKGRYDRKSAQLQILNSFLSKFQQWKSSVLVVTPTIFSLIDLGLHYFHIEWTWHLDSPLFPRLKGGSYRKNTKTRLFVARSKVQPEHVFGVS